MYIVKFLFHDYCKFHLIYSRYLFMKISLWNWHTVLILQKYLLICWLNPKLQIKQGNNFSNTIAVPQKHWLTRCAISSFANLRCAIEKAFSALVGTSLGRKKNRFLTPPPPKKKSKKQWTVSTGLYVSKHDILITWHAILVAPLVHRLSHLIVVLTQDH